MTKKTSIVIVSLFIFLIVLAGLWVFRDLFIGASTEIQCDDGTRRTIDLREFSTRYWVYAMELEVSIKDVANVSGKLDPKELHQLNAAQQQAIEFRKYIVAGFNACAISKSQYLETASRFQALDSVAQQIDGLLKQRTLDSADRKTLQDLVEEYSSMARALSGSDSG